VSVTLGPTNAKRPLTPILGTLVLWEQGLSGSGYLSPGAPVHGTLFTAGWHSLGSRAGGTPGIPSVFLFAPAVPAPPYDWVRAFAGHSRGGQFPAHGVGYARWQNSCTTCSSLFPPPRGTTVVNSVVAIFDSIYITLAGTADQQWWAQAVP